MGRRKLRLNEHTRKILAITLTFALLLVSCCSGSSYSYAAKKIKLNCTSKTIKVGKSVKLSVRNIPSGAKNVKYKWTTDKKSVATVSSKGLVKGKKSGKATIKCKVTYKVKKKKKYVSQSATLKCSIKVEKNTSAKTTPTAAATESPDETDVPQTSTDVPPSGTEAPPVSTENSGATPTAGATDGGSGTGGSQATIVPTTVTTTAPTAAPTEVRATDVPSAQNTPDTVVTEAPTTAPTVAPTTAPVTEVVWSGEYYGKWSNNTSRTDDTVINCCIDEKKLYFYNLVAEKEYNITVTYRYSDVTDSSNYGISFFVNQGTTSVADGEWCGTTDVDLTKSMKAASDVSGKLYVDAGGWGATILVSKVEVKAVPENQTQDRVPIVSLPENVPETDNDAFKQTAAEYAANLGAGINAGNALDADVASSSFWNNDSGKAVTLTTPYVSGSDGLSIEGSWSGYIKLSQEYFDAVKDAGFTTVRIPVSYVNHTIISTDSEGNRTYTIDAEWMARVKTVVDYARNAGLYVIINIHHDGADINNESGDLSTIGGEVLSWLSPIYSGEDEYAEMAQRFASLWTQIANEFKEYDEKLMFEDMNEFHRGYGAPTQDYYKVQNALHQTFVNTVRSTGGNNYYRYLIVSGYNTNIDYTCEGLKVPEDVSVNNTTTGSGTAGHIMVQVHYYSPIEYTEGNTSDNNTWNEKDYAADKYGSILNLEAQMKLMYDNFVSKGIPVVLGEYGATTHSSLDSATDEKYRTYFYGCVVKYASKYKIVPIAWDGGGSMGSSSSGETRNSTYALIDRSTNEIFGECDDIIAAILKYQANPDDEITLAE